MTTTHWLALVLSVLLVSGAVFIVMSTAWVAMRVIRLLVEMWHDFRHPERLDTEPDFSTWVRAQLLPGQDFTELARRLRPAWEAHHNQSDDKLRRARHEAGHAVVAYLSGAVVMSADIRLAGDTGGSVTVREPIPARHPAGAWGSLVMAMAGNAVDLAHGVHDDHSRDDMASAALHARRIISTGLHPDGYTGPLGVQGLIDAARDRARELVAAHADAIELLAEALVESRSMTGQEVHTLLREQAHLTRPANHDTEETPTNE